jgi:hypothetical protein
MPKTIAKNAEGQTLDNFVRSSEIIDLRSLILENSKEIIQIKAEMKQMRRKTFFESPKHENDKLSISSVTTEDFYNN